MFSKLTAVFSVPSPVELETRATPCRCAAPQSQQRDCVPFFFLLYLRRRRGEGTEERGNPITSRKTSLFSPVLSSFRWSRGGHFRRVFAPPRLCVKSVLALLVLLLATFTHAQDSQFHFDPNGNLFVQTAATTSPPEILGQPQNRIVVPDEAASFSVVAADTRLLSYQWRFNGTDITSASNDAVLLQNVSTNNEGEYRVVLTNPSGSVTSAPAMLWIDSDADGLPDSWERLYFTNLNQSATADFDQDGVSNLQEFLDGTNPTNKAAALFRLTVLRDGGSVEILPNQSTYTNGQTVTLTASAFSYETFRAWLGDVVTRTNPVTLVMTNNKTVSARFTPVVFTWTNFAGGDWNHAANWTPNLVPGSNDSVVISGLTLQGPGTFTVTLDTPADCASVTIDTGLVRTPTLTGSGTLTVRESLLWRGGTMSGSGRTVIESGATLTLETVNAFGNGPTVNTRTLELGGVTHWMTAGNLNLNNAIITNRPGAVFHALGSGTLNRTAGTSRFDNAGTFRKSVNAGVTMIGSSVSFNNYAAVEIETGTLLCNGGFTNQGAVHVAANATNRLAGGGTATGTFSALVGGVVEWAVGTFTLLPGAQLDGAGRYRIHSAPGNVTVNAEGNLNVENFDLASGLASSSTLGGTGTVTVSRVMNWTAGTMSGTGQTVIVPGATLQVANPSGVTLARTLENAGTILWTGAGNISLSTAVITNRAGGLFHVQNAAQFLASGGSRFDNTGTFRKSLSTGTTTFASGASFNNYGAVEIEAGTLRLGGGGSSTGTFDAAATTSVEWTGGTFTLNPGAQLNGAGLYRINGGTVTADANLTVENLNVLSGTSTLGGAGTVTVASLMNWTAGVMGGTGRTIIAPGAVLNAAIPSQVNLVTRTLENGGTVLWTNGTIALNGSLITNRPGALFHALGTGLLGNLGGSPRFNNAGTFRKSVNAGIATVANGVSFNNSGEVEIQSGTLLFNGGFTNSGVVNASAGATNRLTGGGSATGTFSASAGAVVEWTAGTFTLNPGAQLNGAGLYRLNAGNVTAGANLIVENLDVRSGSSTLGGAGTVTVASLMNWTAGVMGGTGRTIIAPGAVLNAAIPSQVNLVTRTLENAGTVLWTNGTIALNGSLITNRPGALFHAQGAGLLGNLGGSPRFDNAGTFRKSVNTGTTTVASGVNFTNYGTVDLQSGTLLCNGGYNSTSNAVLNCALGGTTPGTGYAQLQKAGTVTLNGALSVDLLPGFTPTTNDTFAVVTAGTRNGTFANFFHPSNLVVMQMSNTPNSVVLRVTDVFPIVPQPLLSLPELVGSNFNFTWTATSNVTYRLEFNPDLANLTNWNPIPGDVTATSSSASKLDAATSSNRFYRVRVLP